MNFCPKIKALSMALIITLLVAPAFSYSESQRAADFHKHQNYKKKQERKRVSAAKEQSRQAKQLEALREKERKQFIRNGRNKKSGVDKYESQHLRSMAEKKRQYSQLRKKFVRQKKKQKIKRSKSQISENQEFGINTAIDDTKYY